MVISCRDIDRKKECGVGHTIGPPFRPVTVSRLAVLGRFLFRVVRRNGKKLGKLFRMRRTTTRTLTLQVKIYLD